MSRKSNVAAAAATETTTATTVEATTTTKRRGRPKKSETAAATVETVAPATNGIAENPAREFKAMKAKMNIRIIFIEELLGSCPADPEIYEKFIANLASDQDRKDEITAMGPASVVDQGTTKFLTVAGRPALSNHTWIGFFKEKIGFIKGDDKKSASAGMTSYKKKLDTGLGFLNKFSVLVMPNGQEMGKCQRSLRAQTAQGDRIALASSLTVPVGTRTRFSLLLSNPDYRKSIIEALNMGQFTGTGQWRGSGKKGRFLWEEFDDNKNIIGGNTMSVLGVTTADNGFKDALEAYVAAAEYGEIEEDFD